jgi:hypothetical protein
MAITFQRASGNTGTSHTIDIGNSGNNRLIIVIVGDESKSGDIFQGIVTIDGKTCTQALVANNLNGNGNHLEMHVIDEETLGSSNGSLSSGQTAKVVSARYKINSGTSVTAKVQKNDIDVTGFTGLSITTTATTTNPTDISLSDNDKLALIVTSIVGTPKNLSFTLFLEHSV